MSQHLSDVCARYLRIAALVCLGAAALGSSAAGRAMSRAEFYQASVPVADRSEAAQSSAFQAALKSVLIRVTGSRTVDEDPAFTALLANARRYVQQYRAAPDNQLMVAFDGGAIERWLTQNGKPLWGSDRPATSVWLTLQTGPQTGSVVTAADNSDLKSLIDAAAAARGIALIWPSNADLQRNGLDYSNAHDATSGSLAELGHRLGAEGTLIGRASNGSANAIVRWTHLFQDRSSEFSGALEGVNRAADTYAALFAASGTLVPVDIEVIGVGELRAYAGVLTYLESQTFISHVSVQSLNADTLRLRLSTRGGTEPLLRSLALNGRLQVTSAGVNGIQRFKIRR